MMAFHRASASVGKTALVGSLYTLGFVGLASASMIVALIYLPWSLAMNVLGQMTPATLDAIRGIGISSFFGWFALFAFGMGISLTLSAFLTQRKFKIPRSRVINIFVLAAILALWASSAFIVPQVTAISSTQTAEYSQFNTKPCSFYIFTDSTNYYAQNCDTGVIAYGGPGNAGGAMGTSFTGVVNSINSGGLIVFAPATFVVSASTHITPLSSTVYVGSGWNTIIQKAPSPTDADIFGWGSAGTTTANIRISNMKLDANNAASAVQAIEAYDSSNLTLDHLFVTGEANQNAKVFISITSGKSASNIKITDNTFSNYLEVQITGEVTAYVPNSIGISNVLVSGNMFQNEKAGNFGFGNIARGFTITGNQFVNVGSGSYSVDTSYSPDVSVTGNLIRSMPSSSTGIYSEGGDNIAITGNVIDGGSTAGSSGITLNNAGSIGSGLSGRVAISGNVISNMRAASADGIEISGIQGVSVTGNVIQNTSRHAIIFASAGGVKPSDEVISGNTLLNFGMSTASSRGIELISTSNSMISGNMIDSSQALADAGIVELTSASKNTYTSNKILGVATPISILAVKNDTITSNGGYNPVATSSVTAGTSVWTYTNNDGYDEVMQLATAGGISAETCNGVSGWSITVGTSSCVIPPSGTMVVTWATTAPVYTKVPLFA